MRKAIVALLLVTGSNCVRDERGVLAVGGATRTWLRSCMNAGLAKELRTRAAKLQTSATTVDTTWVGYTPGKFNATNNWFSIGSGNDKFSVPTGPYNRPPAQGALWDFEPTGGSYLHGDSAQGWFPYREDMTGTGGLTLPDVQRPWRAIDYGNGANYTPAIIGGRTSNMYGVIGVWHVDVGNTGAGAGKGVAWTPLAGTSSAWMGLRRHGDHTAIGRSSRAAAPATRINEDAMMFDKSGNTVGSIADAPARTRSSRATAAAWTRCCTATSTRSTATVAADPVPLPHQHVDRLRRTNATRTGWFQHDPLTISTGSRGSASGVAESDESELHPQRSRRRVRLRPRPTRSCCTSALRRKVRSCCRTATPWPIGDPKRRWFGEVIRSNENLYDEIFTRRRDQRRDAGDGHRGPGAASTAIKAASGGTVRIVFRVKTNWQFDDETFGFQGFALGWRGRGGHRRRRVLDQRRRASRARWLRVSAAEIDNRVPARPAECGGSAERDQRVEVDRQAAQDL